MPNIILLYKQLQFAPGATAIFFNPFYFIRKGLYKGIKKFAPLIGGRVLDVGCGSKPYKNLFVNASQYIGIDIDNPGHDHHNENIDAFYNGKNIPFENHSFDSVLCSEVIEHVFEPNEFIVEIARILKPGGKLLITCPFVWNEHEMPYDCARYTKGGLTHLLEKNGFSIAESHKSGHFAQVITQLVMLYIFHRFPKNKFARLALNVFFIFPFALMGCLLVFVLPKDKSLYFNSIIVAKKQK